MPKPRFIVCSQSGSEDKDTQLLSLFNLIDKLVFSQTPVAGSPIVELRITASWAKEENDDGKHFELQARLNIPGSAKSVDFPIEPFTFSAQNYRFTGRILGMPPVMKAGDLVITVKIREANSLKWIEHSTQECLIPIEVNEHQLQAEPSVESN